MNQFIATMKSVYSGQLGQTNSGCKKEGLPTQVQTHAIWTLWGLLMYCTGWLAYRFNHNRQVHCIIIHACTYLYHPPYLHRLVLVRCRARRVNCIPCNHKNAFHSYDDEQASIDLYVYDDELTGSCRCHWELVWWRKVNKHGHCRCKEPYMYLNNNCL